MKKKLIIIGGGAAGMMAAALTDPANTEVTIVEHNEKLGKKLFITGKGRCNITNACDRETLFDNILVNKRFLYSSFGGFNNYDVIDFFENEGLKTKIERGNRVFPVSDHSSDVIKALEKRIRSNGVHVLLGTEAKNLDIDEDGIVRGVELSDGTELAADYVLVATGGLSYPSTGSTGDGYRMARTVGHQVSKLYPSLTQILVKESFVGEVEGLSLKNVRVSFRRGEKLLYEDMGEMLFTRKGVSGPLILSGQALVGEEEISKGNITIHIDLKPALTEEVLDKRVLKDFEEEPNRQFKNSLFALLPRTLCPVIVRETKISPEKQVNQVSKEERMRLVKLLKDLKMSAVSSGGYNEAVVTRGGVEVDKLQPKTMESKLVKNLFFAGEVLNVDAFTGGFNLQIAWSTGAAVALEINRRSIEDGTF